MSYSGFVSDAARGFTMEAMRTYKGELVDFNSVKDPPFPRPADANLCDRWAVLTSIVEPTASVYQLAELTDWCVVVVGDKNGESLAVIRIKSVAVVKETL